LIDVHRLPLRGWFGLLCVFHGCEPDYKCAKGQPAGLLASVNVNRSDIKVLERILDFARVNPYFLFFFVFDGFIAARF
jgi:hypothetical protein